MALVLEICFNKMIVFFLNYSSNYTAHAIYVVVDLVPVHLWMAFKPRPGRSTLPRYPNLEGAIVIAAFFQATHICSSGKWAVYFLLARPLDW